MVGDFIVKGYRECIKFVDLLEFIDIFNKRL